MPTIPNSIVLNKKNNVVNIRPNKSKNVYRNKTKKQGGFCIIM